jgi:hypothetical protein
METINRIPEPSTNGTPAKKARKPYTRKPKSVPVPVTTESVAVAPVVNQDKPNDHIRAYAYAGVGLLSVLSAGLNGYANSLHSPIEWAGWMMGISIPLVILILGKVAGLQYRRGFRRAAYITGGTGVGLLFLSIWHCATSISILTGSPIMLAVPMAVAIDAGFVCCEVAVIMAD